MADKLKVKAIQGWRRKMRVRTKVFGTSVRPRLTVFKSLNNMTAQIIDDEKSITIVGLSTGSTALKGAIKDSDKKTAQAKLVGKTIAEMAKAKGIELVVFDRNKYRYHGRVKAVAEGAREGGLKF
jgi:large subunit ribosomal protein L18